MNAPTGYNYYIYHNLQYVHTSACVQILTPQVYMPFIIHKVHTCTDTHLTHIHALHYTHTVHTCTDTYPTHIHAVHYTHTVHTCTDTHLGLCFPFLMSYHFSSQCLDNLITTCHLQQQTAGYSPDHTKC